MERNNTSLLSKNTNDVPQEEEVNLFATLPEVGNETLSFNHVPPEEVPDHEVRNS